MALADQGAPPNGPGPNPQQRDENEAMAFIKTAHMRAQEVTRICKTDYPPQRNGD